MTRDGMDKDPREARIAYMGTPAFAGVVLEGLLRDGWNLVCLVTQPDRRKGRGKQVAQPETKRVALAHGLPVLQPESLKEPAFVASLKGFSPDLSVVASFGNLLPASVLSLPRLGSYNVHGSVLPAYRGASPIQWAIVNGEQETGIAIFRMARGMDTGDVVEVGRLAIGANETAGELADRMASLACDLLPGTLEKLVRGDARHVAQDPARATYAPLLRKEHGHIDWSLPAEAIRNRIRGLDPWPGCYTQWQGRRLQVWDARTEGGDAGKDPGVVVSVSAEGLRVQTGDGILRLSSLKLEGKKRMGVGDFIRGQKLEEGQRFG